MDEEVCPNDTLLPVMAALRKVVKDDVSPATAWRWAQRGLQIGRGDRIRLEVWYLGRRAYTTIAAVHAFMNRITQARLENRDRDNSRQRDGPDDAELRRAGLL